jgi:hypothetical protein
MSIATSFIEIVVERKHPEGSETEIEVSRAI